MSNVIIGIQISVLLALLQGRLGLQKALVDIKYF